MMHSRNVSLKIIVLFISTIFSLYLVECILRIFFVIPAPLANYYPFAPAKASSAIYVKQYEFESLHSYNTQGFRDEEIRFNKQDHERRILFLGDSFTEGYGVSVEERFSNKLIKKLGENFYGINVGQLATNPDNYFDNLISFGIALKPDIVIMGIFIGNDFMGGRAYKMPTHYQIATSIDNNNSGLRLNVINFITLKYTFCLVDQVLTKNEKLLKKTRNGNFWELYYGNKVTKEFFMKSAKIDEETFNNITRQFNQTLLTQYYNGMIIPTLLLEGIQNKLPSGSQKNDENYYNKSDYDNTFFFIKETAKILTNNNIKLIVLIMPDIHQVHPLEFMKTLRNDFLIEKTLPKLRQLEEFRYQLINDLESDHIQYLDVTNSLRKSRVLTYYLYDNHMNKYGHEIVSNELFKMIRN